MTDADDFSRFGPRVAAILAVADHTARQAAAGGRGGPSEFAAAQSAVLAGVLRAILRGSDWAPHLPALMVAGIHPQDVAELAMDGFAFAKASRRAAA